MADLINSRTVDDDKGTLMLAHTNIQQGKNSTSARSFHLMGLICNDIFLTFMLCQGHAKLLYKHFKYAH